MHHRHKAGQLCSPAVQVQCGERPCKAPDVEAPERDAGQGSRQPRPQGAGQLAVLGLLISSPMDRRGMLTSVARPAEQRLSRTQMFGVSRRILLGIAALSGPAGASIRKAHIFPVDELASIGLEPVYPHLCEIVSLGKPGLLCGRVGEVGDHGAGEPVSLRDGIGTPICVVDAEAPGDGIRLVQLILRIERLIRPLLFVDGDLPQQETDPLLVKPLYHTSGIRPGGIGKIEVLQPECAAIRLRNIPCAPENIKGSLIAPRLGHQGADWKAVFLRLRHRPLHFLLAVPVVGGDPRPKGPFGRQLCRAEQIHVIPNDLSGHPRKQHDAAIHRQLRANRFLTKSEAGALIRGRI